MPYARDEAGHIWETDPQGNPVRLAQQAQPQMPADPTFPTKGPQAVATLNNTQATTGHTAAEIPGAAAESRIKVATAPAAISSAQSEAALKALQAQEAQHKLQDTAKADKMRQASSLLNTDTVLQAINEARQHIGPFTTGAAAAVTSHIPPIPYVENGDGYKLARNLDTVRGNIAFDKYTQLKENMPQGAQGGIRLTDNELKLLQNLQGSTDQHLDANTLNDHLNLIEQRYRQNAALASGLDPTDPSVMGTFGIKPPAPGSMTARLNPHAQGGDQLTPQLAKQDIADARAVLEKKIATLPPRAKAIGYQKFNSDPRIQSLMAVARGTVPPPRQQQSTIDFNDLPER